MAKYAIMIEVDPGDWIYVCNLNEGKWGPDSPVAVYETREEAEVAAQIWNNPEVVVYHEPIHST